MKRVILIFALMGFSVVANDDIFFQASLDLESEAKRLEEAATELENVVPFEKKSDATRLSFEARSLKGDTATYATYVEKYLELKALQDRVRQYFFSSKSGHGRVKIKFRRVCNTRDLIGACALVAQRMVIVGDLLEEIEPMLPKASEIVIFTVSADKTQLTDKNGGVWTLKPDEN